MRRHAERQGLARDAALVAEFTRLLPALLRTPLDTDSAVDPLPGIPKGFALAQLTNRDRLDELRFDLRLGAGVDYQRSRRRDDANAPVVGSNAIDGCVDLVGVKKALDAALQADEPALAPVRGWVEHHLQRARDGQSIFTQIAGILTGSIDLVFRVRGAHGGDDRYFLADYKTNKIAASESGHYASAWLDWKMATTGYPLQALLYSVALHRHLRLRLGDRYDYDRHFGGTLYLFVRGMAGPQTPRDPRTGRSLGVFAHRWSRDTIETMDTALSPGANP